MTGSASALRGPSIDALLAPHAARSPARSAADAAVLILLRPGANTDGPEVLLIERTHRPDDPAAGHVSLPGGRVDPTDVDLAATALRETEEEVGVVRADLATDPRFVGIRHASAFEMQVGIFASEWRLGAPSPHARSPSEVARVFWLPRAALDAATRVPRETSRGPIEVPATVHDGAVLWGFTRRVLRSFFGMEDDDPRNARPPARSGRWKDD